MLLLAWVALGRRGTRWAVIAGITLAATTGFKLVCFALTGPWPFSPSGHTASAAVVYGGLAWLLLRRAAGPVAAACAAVLPAIVIGWSRLALHAHTVPEVVVGALIGGAGLLWLMQAPVPGLARGRVWSVRVAVPLVWVAFHGQSLGIEELLRGLARTW